MKKSQISNLKSQNYGKKFLIFSLYFIFYASCFMVAHADGYTLLESLPGKGQEVSGLSDYLSWLFNFALVAAAFLALLMIVIAGIQMMAGGASESARKDARDRIWSAVWGLLLALCAWLILNTISSDFVKGKFELEPVTIRAPAPKLPTGEWATKLADDSTTRAYLQSHSVYTNNGPCPKSYNDKNCTMVSDLPQNAVDGVIKIASKDGADTAITITGGTEIGVHKEHGPNKSVLDLRYKSSGGENPNTKLKIYLDKQVGKTMQYGDRIDTKDGKMNILFEKNSDGSEHFHITFK